MKKLCLPDLQTVDVYKACISRISDKNYRQKLKKSQQDICDAGKKYNELANQESLYIIEPLFPRRGEDPFVINDELTRNDLTELYTQKMASKNGPGRFVYDQIIVAASDWCPFCGGIGQVSTLDHYLPKAHFPIYSIYPANLVPCCSDCNKAKGNSVITRQDDQVLHPYFDKDFYFDQKWVSANLIFSDHPVLNFFADPPEDWSPVCKARVKAHFKKHNLEKKYKIISAEALSEIIYQRKTTMNDFAPEEFREHLVCMSNSPYLKPNHWKHVMYTALSQNTSFLSKTF